MAFDFVAAYAESPVPFFVAGDTTGTPRLSEAPQQVTLRFAPGVQLDPASIGGSVSFVRSVDGVFGDANDVSVMPVAPIGSVTVGDVPNENEVVIRFAETLPDDLYRVAITSGLKSTGGDTAGAFQFDVRLDLGAFVTAVVPQPVERLGSGGLEQHRDQVIVYFNAGDPLSQASAETSSHYRLVPVSGAGVDGTPITPASVTYSAATAKAVLTFATGAIADGMLYRLEIGPTLTPGVPTAVVSTGTAADDNSSFLTATRLGNLAANGITVSARIDDRPTVPTPAGSLVLPNQPGTVDEPGHRDTPADSGAHGLADLTTNPGLPPWVLSRGADGPVGYYNFRSEYGRDPQGNALFNTITEAQKQRTREVFESFSKITGIRFVEEVRAPYIGLTVVTGDIRAVSPTTPPGPGGIIGIAGTSRVGTGLFSRLVPTVVMDSFENWGESEYGGSWFRTAMHEIGHAMGLPHSYDLPSIMGYGLTGEAVFPGDYDSIHLKELFPTTGTDIDVYSFTVSEPGRLSAETVAGRPGTAVTSFLDSVLSLYREERVLQAGMSVFGEGIAANTTVIAVDRTGRTITLSTPTTKALPAGTRLELAGGRLALTTDGATASGAVTCKVLDLGPTVRTLVARNDDYYGRDSFVGLDLEQGDYFVAVTSTGNDQFNPEVSDSGYGGRTRGAYELRLGFTPAQSSTNTIEDARCTPLDGDRDGLPGGTHAFWFKTASTADTIFVDKAAASRTASITTGSVTVTGLDVTNLAIGMLVKGDGIADNTRITAIGAGAATFSRAALKTNITASLTFSNGTVAFPHVDIDDALAAVAASTKIIRIIGNAVQRPYLVGTTLTGQTLADGATFNVPKGVTVMIDAGAVFKLRSAIIDVGSSQLLPTSSRAEAALQVLGVPGSAVTITSYHDDSIGGNSDGFGPAVAGGQWGGLVFRRDSDASSKRAFVNAVQQADVRYGGGQVRVDSQVQSFAPIQIESTRPTIAFNTIAGSAGAAIAATPNSFEESNGRIGPEIRGNRLVGNSTNGLFVKIFTRFGSPLEQLDVPARFKSTDITYVFQENLVITGGAGGYSLDVSTGRFASRSTGRLAIDPGVVVKLQNSRIELERGASQLIAEGGEFNPVIFTSLGDNRYGAGGTFDTNGNVLPDKPVAGDWGGIVLNAGTRASIDRAYLAFGGGLTPIEGTSDSFNVLEVHQGDLRLTNTRIEQNLSGAATSDRTGRGTNAAATVFVRGAQPIIVGNDFRANAGAVVSINANSLSDVGRPDVGRSTGSIQRFARFDANVGPLVADNVLSFVSGAAAIAGMKVRGEEITVEGVWDDADIVHVLEDEIIVRNFHTATGLRLQSRPDASLVVKLRGAAAGITAEGYGLDIDDRIGGTVQVVGQPGRPVILTSVADDTVGASVDPLGRTVTDTANDGVSTAAPGDWRSLKFLPLSNDRNVSVYVEAERPLTSGLETNAVVDDAEDLGVLAPNFPTGSNSWESAQEKSGDENRRLGFEVHGLISPDDPTDVDVYAFHGYAGSEIWIDVDKTASGLDAMVELLNSFGNVLARSVDEGVESKLVSTSVPDAIGGLAVTYPLGNTNVVQGTLVGTLVDDATGLAIQDFSIAADGSITFYDRNPLNLVHATGAFLDPVNGLLTLTFDNAAGPTRINVSYVYATGSLSAATLGLGQSAQRDGWRGGDYYTTNPRDPGMRLVLPGTTGDYLRYYVRVRSQPRQDAATLASFPGVTPQERYEASLQSTTFDQPGDLAAGVTSGAYELRVRLRQRDEKPGSVVRYADIRYPTVGIDVLGLPRNSLLAGETGETTQANDTLAGAQYVGNLLEADRNTISIAGELGSTTDVDWYQFALNYEQIQGTSKPPAWATVFDLDYADGFRGDLTLAVFDAAGTLLYVGRDSDIRDDQPGAGQGNDFDDVSRGTLGKLDPFIGTVQLPTDNPKGTRAGPADPANQLKYYVAVMSNGQLPSQLNATFQSAAGNTLVRLEPVTSVKRVIEDHIGFTGYTSNGVQVDQTTLDPATGGPRPLIDISSATALSTHVRPFTLADVTLFVSSQTGLFTVDAVTGTRETTVRTGITGVTIGDLDMRTDGKLYAYAGVNGSVTTVGRLLEVDAGNGTFLSSDDDEIENVATTPLNYQTTSDTVTALAFRRTGVAQYDELWFVAQDGPESKLYRAADGGTSAAAANAQADQPQATSNTLGYRGRILDPVTNTRPLVTGLQFENDAGTTLFGVTADGKFGSIAPGTKLVGDTPDFDATFTELADFSALLPAGATGFRGLAAAPRNVDGGSLAGMFVAVTNNGRLCVIDPAVPPGFPAANFLVPRLEWGAGAVFSPAITGVTGITGLAFSPLDINLWHPTERRGDTARDTVTAADPGHGINGTSDNTRTPGVANRTADYVNNAGVTTDSRTHSEDRGGLSMYFGLEEYQASGTPAYLLTDSGQAQYGADPDWHQDLTSNPLIRNNYNLPGGSYGSLITNSFSLATSTYTDKPTLYFNYWLETQDASGKVNEMRDSARVLISVDQGLSWQLLATNNSSLSTSRTTDAELPTVISASSAISTYANQHVQELFDTANWRQARVDLGKWAGSADIRLRFDFHTAGEFDPNQVDAAGNRINTISGLANTTGNFNSAERGQNNQFEGFYVDDIIVGFAERGEVVTSATTGSTGVFAVNTPPGVTQALQGPYQLEIRRGTEYSVATGDTSPNTSANMAITRTFDTNERLISSAYSATGALRGDSNLPREQGQFVIDSNIVASAATYGISIDAGARDTLSNLPHPGVARNVPTLNNGRLVPGAFVVNNVVTSSGTAGIRFSGDPNTPIPSTGGAPSTPVPTAVVPFGRIVNNTIYGGSASQGVGIEVTDNAGPTLMNNLFANLATGVTVDASSQRDTAGKERTVVTHSGFWGVAAPVTGVTDKFRVSLPASPFVNAAAGNFYPVAGTPAIDTSLNSLQDRNEFLVVNSPLGIPAAPILAPEKDLYGQLRWDDPAQTPSLPGLGLNVYKDLGAIDRVDFSQSLPYLVILDPRDNGPADAQTAPDAVVLTGSGARNRRFFTFQVIDPGAGIDPGTVVASAFTLTRDAVPLVEGTDYVFRFVEASNRVVFEAASIFKPGAYKVEAKSTIADRAGNPLRPNKPETGSTEFEIRLLDAPYAPTWPAPMTPLAPLPLAGWHEDQTIHLGWTPAFTVLPDLPIIDYDVEMSTDNCFPAGQTVTLTATAFSTVTSLSKSSLVNGTSYWFRVRAINSLGIGPWSEVLGPIVPQPKPTIALDEDTCLTDDITSNGQVNVDGVAAGARWQYRIAAGTWTDASGTSFILPEGSYPAGVVQVRQIIAGFPGVPTTNASQWVIDSTSPPAPVITSVTDNVSPMMGSIAAGGFTNDPTPTFTGTAQPGATLSITINGGPPITQTVPPSGIWTYTPSPLTDGPHVFAFVAIDAACNESLATTFSLTVDTVPPAAPVITSVTDDVLCVVGTILAGGITNDPTPTFTGTAAADVSSVRVSINGGTSVAIPVSNGTWSFTPSALIDAGYTFSFVAVDIAFNESPATTFSLTIDTLPPAAPVITSVTDNVSPVIGSIPAGGVTNDPTPTFTGTATAGVSSVRVSINGGTPVTLPVSNGAWNFTPATPLVDDSYTFSFVAIDAAFNESPTITYNFIIDTVAPTVASVMALSPSGTYGIGQLVDILVTFSEAVTVTGGAALQLNTTPPRSASYLSGTGTKVLTFRYVIQIGDSSVRLDHASASALSGTFTDGAGNPATLTLPAPGSYLGSNIVIDALIKATIPGLGQPPADPPDFASPLTSLQVLFNTPVTGFTVNSFSLERWDETNQAWRPVSRLSIGVTGSSTNWTITFPSSSNPTSLKGRYRICIGGPNSGILAGGVTMDNEVCWYFDRV